MQTVTVHASRQYDVVIGQGLLQQAGEQIAAALYPEASKQSAAEHENTAQSASEHKTAGQSASEHRTAAQRALEHRTAGQSASEQRTPEQRTPGRGEPEQSAPGNAGSEKPAAGKTAMLASDDNVHALYGAAVRASLEKAGFRVLEFVFPHGEASKNLQTYGALLGRMCAGHMSRSDVVVALGGGVTGDLAGFAAATYQRGTGFVQIPTSLLAAVDSSVGGKTAVDLPEGKNQAGCFYQPALVLCDTDTLRTLPEEEYRNGCAEVLKYGMIADRAFFFRLLDFPVRDHFEEVIARCVAMKRDVVEKDEFDTGLRMLLNFGHTFGHAVEACSDYTIPHGQAVAIGMASITKAACALGYCADDVPASVGKALDAYRLPQDLPFAAQELADAALSDKKAQGSAIRLIVPKEIGSCSIEKIEQADLLKWLHAGGAK